MNQHKKSIFRKFPKTSMVIISFIVCFLVLVSIELLLGALNKTYSINEYGNPRLIALRELPPGLNLTRIKNDSSQINIKSDENGFIFPSKVHNRADLTLVFLGGSTTECRMVDEQSRFPYLCGRLLEEKTGKKINSYNASLGGNDLSHTVNTLWNKAIALNPNYAIVMHNINDLFILERTGTYWSKSVRPKIINLNRMEAVMGPLYNYKRPYFMNLNQLYQKLESKISNEESINNEWASAPKTNNGLDSLNIISQYEMALRSYILICISQKITPILMTQFNLITGVPHETHGFNRNLIEKFKKQGFEYKDFQVLYTKMNEINRELAAEYQIPLFDLDKLVPKETKYFYDIIHLNQEGSILVSDLLSQRISNLISIQ